jgi:hypothetical protein
VDVAALLTLEILRGEAIVFAKAESKFAEERLLPVDNIEAETLADEILRIPPPIGYLTISNALQWRLQYSRVIEQAGKVEGVLRLE